MKMSNKMGLLNFEETFELLAFNFHRRNQEQYPCLEVDAQLIVDKIMEKLKKNGSVFHGYLGNLRSSASFPSQINLDMPLNFEIFLPLRLPFALNTRFNKAERTVQLNNKKTSISHPFLLNNLVNSECMNMLLQADLKRAVGQLECIFGCYGVKYDVKYSALSYNGSPFAHQVFAVKRGSIDRGIQFDFILALEFDSSVLSLPSYYNAPASYKWLAYGLVAASDKDNSANWGVLIPWWRTADSPTREHSINLLMLLYRLLYSQRCYCLAMPFLVKLCFFMTTVDLGEGFKNMGTAKLMIRTLYHQVSHNFCETIVSSTVGDLYSNIAKTKALRKQQARAKGIYAMLSKGLQLNVISAEFISEFFKIDYKPPLDLIEASSSRKRRIISKKC